MARRIIPSRPLFLERRTYRQNRLQDAARLLPVLGLVLLFGPIFIRGSGAGEVGPTLSGGLVYYFAIWLVLIVLTAVISRPLVGSTRDGADPAADPTAPPASTPPADPRDVP